ncbi:amidohydrolase [Paenibacillus sp. NPDC058071]|uniref:amidohydrolase n=1 Tax=Paenibacillus sp. NPDC058071 TaxID=3346326 RepID=UPI0036DBA36F
MAEQQSSVADVQQLDFILTEYRRHLHQYPELSNEEFETTAFIKSKLEEAGIRIVDYGLATGVIAEVGALPGNGPIVAIRADIDALPITEETGLPYASRIPGKMHACGHDFHTSAIIGTALLLKSKEQELNGTVRFIFQPAEEKAVGAQRVIDSGALTGVQAIFGMHNKPDLPVGTVGVKEGPLMAAADGFIIEVNGKGSHAAVPQAGLDPIVASAHIVTALQSIVSRNVSPLESAVVSVTKIIGGTTWNVIPEKAVMEGTVRTFGDEVRETVLARFEQTVVGVASALGLRASVKWIQGPPAVINDKRLADIAAAAAAPVGLKTIVPVPSSAGEDFAFYQKAIPGVFVFMGTSGSQEWHHPAFDLDERALPLSARYFTELAVAALDELAR